MTLSEAVNKDIMQLSLMYLEDRAVTLMNSIKAFHPRQ